MIKTIRTKSNEELEKILQQTRDVIWKLEGTMKQAGLELGRRKGKDCKARRLNRKGIWGPHPYSCLAKEGWFSSRGDLDRFYAEVCVKCRYKKGTILTKILMKKLGGKGKHER